MKSRRAAELIHRFALERLGPGYEDRLSPYRAGYTPAQRRDIERRLVEGELLGVSATDALELGIDVGLLDAVVSVGFPGTVASLRQQWGRAGRRGHGLAVLVASEDALDQYFMREPETLLGRRVEAAILDHANPRLLDGHVLAAAFEGPIDDGDRETLGDAALERAALLPELQRTPAGYVWAGRDYPAARVSLRSASPDPVLIVESGAGSVLGTVERERAYSTAHEGAVYLHLGETYLVRALDLQTGTAPRRPVHRRLVHTGEEGDDHGDRGAAAHRAPARPRAHVRASLGDRAGGRLPAEVDARRQGARPRRARSAASTFETEAIWFLPEPSQLDGLNRMPKLLGTLHAAEHALIALLPLWAMCDRWDIGGLSTNVHPQTQRPTVFVYDGHPGGVGITERGFAAFEGWAADTARMIEGCPCEQGCPSCVQSPKCGNLNDMLDKAGALELLKRMLRAG